LKGFSLLGKVDPPFPLKTIQVLNGHENSMAHLCDDMRIDIEVNDGKSHFNRSLKMAGEGTEITPLFKKLVVAIDPLFELNEVSPPPHLTEELSFIKFKGFALLKISAELDCPDSKRKMREVLTISIGKGERDLYWHGAGLKSPLTNAKLIP
jgi:hypothetical protein